MYSHSTYFHVVTKKAIFSHNIADFCWFFILGCCRNTVNCDKVEGIGTFCKALWSTCNHLFRMPTFIHPPISVTCSFPILLLANIKSFVCLWIGANSYYQWKVELSSGVLNLWNEINNYINTLLSFVTFCLGTFLFVLYVSFFPLCFNVSVGNVF